LEAEEGYFFFYLLSRSV